MSEKRTPVEIWTRRLLQNNGKKQPDSRRVKIEIFPAWYWSEYWEPGSTAFSPKPPLQSEARRAYWASHFRVRVDGKWVGTRAKYVVFTREQILDRYFVFVQRKS